MWTAAFATEQAARRFLGWLRDVPVLLAGLFTAWMLWPDPVPPSQVYDEFPASAAERTIAYGLPFPVRPYVDLERWEKATR